MKSDIIEENVTTERLQTNVNRPVSKRMLLASRYRYVKVLARV